jgi:uncharacterized Zn-finger protein
MSLQTHKRESHRNSWDMQAGQHKCERINPSTGKPCNSIFIRPYDLTRHEDVIHNTRKRKVKCEFCSDKTFSRVDALVRHMRVVHPEVDFDKKKAFKIATTVTLDGITENVQNQKSMRYSQSLSGSSLDPPLLSSAEPLSTGFSQGVSRLQRETDRVPSESHTRRRVWKACDRCRLKKSKVRISQISFHLHYLHKYSE